MLKQLCDDRLLRASRARSHRHVRNVVLCTNSCSCRKASSILKRATGLVSLETLLTCPPFTFVPVRNNRSYRVKCVGDSDADSDAEASATNSIGTSPDGLSAVVTIQTLSAELASGEFWPQARQVFPDVPWGPEEVLKIMLSGIALVIAAAAILATPAFTSSRAPGFHEQAQQHLLSEVALAVVMPGLLLLLLRGFQPQNLGFFRIRADAAQLQQALLLCCVVFPLVDPLLYTGWSQLLQPVVGAPPPSSYVQALQGASSAGDWGGLAAQFTASCALTPFWEEVFWRGFLLASFTKVLPLPLAVAFSSVNFAIMHLSVHNFLPLLLLSACCDLLYLRTANLLPGMLFHAAWNGYQLVAICALGKMDFV